MKYDDFIYEFIKLLMSWGTWKDSVKIYYGNNIYSPCQWPKRSTGNFWNDYEWRIKTYEANIEKSVFRDINNVVISNMDDRAKAFKERWPDKYEMFVEFNGPLNNLFAYGILETDLSDLPLSRKIEAYQEREEYQREFQMEYDEYEIRNYPEEYEFPSELDFASADEYKEFIEEELDKAETDFIKNMCGTIEYGADLEAEIGSLCIDHELFCNFTGDGLFIESIYF